MEWGFTNLRVFHLPVKKGVNFLESLWESSERKLCKKGIPDIYLINATLVYSFQPSAIECCIINTIPGNFDADTVLYELSKNECEGQELFRWTKTEFYTKIASLKELLKDKLQGGGIS